MSRCPACDERIAETDRECPSCGESLAPPKKKGNNTVLVVLLTIAGLGVMAMCALPILIALLLPAVQQARVAARRAQSKNNLKMIGLAEHMYSDVHVTFTPSGSFGENDTPHHSWQTMLLPMMDQQPLYNTIDQSAPWTDPAQRAAFTQKVPSYLDPNQAMVTSADGLALTHYTINANLAGPNKAMKLGEVTDGLSNTIMLGEVATGFVPWGDPSNARDPALGIGKGLGMFGSNYFGGANIVMADGAVRFLSENIDPAVLKALSTPNGGETVRDTDF